MSNTSFLFLSKVNKYLQYALFLLLAIYSFLITLKNQEEHFDKILFLSGAFALLIIMDKYLRFKFITYFRCKNDILYKYSKLFGGILFLIVSISLIWKGYSEMNTVFLILALFLIIDSIYHEGSIRFYFDKDKHILSYEGEKKDISIYDSFLLKNDMLVLINADEKLEIKDISAKKKNIDKLSTYLKNTFKSEG